MTIRVAYASDLHLDFEDAEMGDEFFKPEADVLVLAGDTSEERHFNHFHDFFARCADSFPHVVMIAGNHEFYKDSYPSGYNKLREHVAQYSNIHFLERELFHYKGYNFFGATLWTDIPPDAQEWLRYVMNDYKHITQSDSGYRKLDPARTVLEHCKSKRWLQEAVAESEFPAIVVTHHAPCMESANLNQRYRGDPVNVAYATSLDDLILDEPKIKAWIHGHLHNKPINYQVGDNCTVYANTRGYPHQRIPDSWDGYVPQVFVLPTENIG